jgi:ABC-type xylose transport system permease subunit
MAASHFPKNHPLRPFYRFLGFLAGLYCLLFGIIGTTQTAHEAVFARTSERVFGLQTNLGFAVASVVVGAIIVIVIVIGRNIDRSVNMVLGPVFIVAGLAMMALMQTSANFLNFEMSTCVVSFVIGLILMASAFYSEVAPREEAEAEDQFRRGGPDPESELRRHP